MSKRIFTTAQINTLRANPSVQSCSQRTVTYTLAFKERALRQHEAGMSPQQIFTEAGLDLDLIGRKQPKQCLERWCKKWKQKGRAGLADTRGRPRRNKAGPPAKLTPAARIRRLEAEVTYLREENAFLAKRRAQQGKRISSRAKSTPSSEAADSR